MDPTLGVSQTVEDDGQGTESEDDTMRMMRSPTESPFQANTQGIDLSPTAINLEIIDIPSSSNKRKKTETLLDTEAVVGRGDMNELNQLIHSEAEVLRDLFEQDKAAKRFTVQQRKELNSAHDRILSITRDITYEYALIKGELNANEKRLRSLEKELTCKTTRIEKPTTSYATAVKSNVNNVNNSEPKPDKKVKESNNTKNRPGTKRATQTIEKKLDME